MDWYWEWKWSLVLTFKDDLDFPRIYVWDCNDIKGLNVTISFKFFFKTILCNKFMGIRAIARVLVQFLNASEEKCTE